MNRYQEKKNCLKSKLEKSIRFSSTEEECLTQEQDPFLNGPYRGKIKTRTVIIPHES